MKKCIAAVLGLLVMAFATVCFAAGSYQMTYEAKNFTEQLKDNQALTETFTTPYGPIKFQMRKLWNSSSDKNLHLIVWLNDKRIDDEHFPKVDYGYTFRVLKNTSNSEQFYVLQSIERSVLFGYSPNAQKLEVYIDSHNYAHEAGAYPYIVALKNGDLVLAFEKNNKNRRYRFNWDANANWFGYSDLGTGWSSVGSDKQ
ncbi:hypothetical protein [uncultured Anaerovibrio sp.]|uniref:hypothetical protein n=1 Tax=uncultured Anaerovibrio sp. TaxID=361586 RepID=UPI0025E542BA|nr:hypothetical protein [uncultured Anaerovibrio sp.]